MLYGSGMKRALFLSFVAALTATAACGGGGDKSFESLCTTQVPPPAACQTTCDPTAGAAVSCPSGFHCATGGKCDSVCTPGGTECGTGFTCTADGFCKDPSSSGSPDAGGTVGGSDPDAACIDLKFTTTRVIPSIQLLIDRSGSMADGFDGNAASKTNPQKFATEVTALVGAAGVVTQLEASVYFGASMYTGPTCGTLFSVPRALSNTTNIAALLNDPAHKPAGNTPTAESIDAAVADFQANPPPAGSPPVIVLATDGLPNTCDSSDVNDASKAATVTAAANAFKAKFPLYVLAVGNGFDSDLTFKQALTDAGQGIQNATTYSATNTDSLTKAFQDIIRGVVSCDLNVTNGTINSDDAASGTVTVDGTKLTYMTDWTLDASGKIIHVIGAACTALKNSANPVVEATFPCGGGVIF